MSYSDFNAITYNCTCNVTALRKQVGLLESLKQENLW